MDRSAVNTSPYPNPFPVGSIVGWKEDAPETWRFIWSPGPWTVVDAYWSDGVPSDYLMRFVEKFGGDRPPLMPGWIITVEYDPDALNQHDPPYRILFGKDRLSMRIHEMWLVPVPKEDQ